MPNSTQFRFVIQTSTTNSVYCDLARRERLPALVSGAVATDLVERSRTSARASLAASAAAESASSSTVLLPSAMLQPPARSPGTQNSGANHSGQTLAP